jgi:hypothetical protein
VPRQAPAADRFLTNQQAQEQQRRKIKLIFSAANHPKGPVEKWSASDIF